MANTIEAKVRHRFTASPERVFDAWLDVDTVRDWMAMPFGVLGGRPMDVRRVEIDPRAGGRFTFSDMREDGEAVHWGTYLEVDRPATGFVTPTESSVAYTPISVVDRIAHSPRGTAAPCPRNCSQSTHTAEQCP